MAEKKKYINVNSLPRLFSYKVCDKNLSSYKSLWRHNKTFHKDMIILDNTFHTKSIILDNTLIIPEKYYNCRTCNKQFKNFQNRWKHEKICKKKIDELVKSKEELRKTNDEITKTKQQLTTKDNNNKGIELNTQLINVLVEKTKTIEELKNKLDEKPVEINKEDIIIKSFTLTLNDVVIVSRSEDKYINATQLCQAGGKKFSHWYSLDTTKKLINVLETNAGIPALDLVKTNVGGLHLGSWIHPDLAIQLAQWISPEFALQVSSWIRQLLTNGSVSVNIKLKEKYLELKLKNEEIKLLKDTFIKNNNEKNMKII